MTDKMIILGTAIDENGGEHKIGLPLKDLTTHGFMFGTTGSGKSTALLNLALQTFDLGGKRYFDLDNQEVTGSITLASFESKILTADPSGPSLAHAIDALKISAGMSVSGYSLADTDFNNDMNIGIEDAIIVLQKLAGTRD